MQQIDGAPKKHLPAIGRRLTRDDIHHGGLASAIRTNDASQFTRRDIQRQAVDGFETIETDVHILQVENSPAREIVPGMKAARMGVILNIASTAGLSPRPRLNWYNASKGWMITATKTMAVELAPTGIRVNALCPVAGETPLLASFMGEDTPEMRAKFLSTIPLGRFSTPHDMGEAAAFLCSNAASMITGVALEVDGGRCI